MIRIALIGGGEIADSYKTVAARLPHVVFTAIVDRDPDAAQRAARLLGAIVTDESIEGLLARRSNAFDAVIIHESDKSRVATIERAAKGGKHVLVASPLADSVEAAERVIEACRSSQVRLMVGHSLRFMPSRTAVKAALDSGKLGEPGLLRIHRWTGSSGGQEAKSIVMQHAVNGIDLANWLFAGLPNRVYALGRPGYVQVHLGFSNGGMALIDHATNLPDGDGYSSLSLIGSTGAADADDHHNRNLLFRGGIPSAIDTGEGPFHLIAQLAEFVSAIEEKREPAVTGNDGKAALQVAEAAVASLESHRALRLAGGSYEFV